MAGGLIVPYVPKVFYSIPGATQIIGNHCILTIGDQEIIGTGSWSLSSMPMELHLTPKEAAAFLFGTGEKQDLGTIPIGRLTQ